ncbi:hypothetical protein IQ06DRAFT_303546 [Phaeosphaeriaceae sp. SRC1lsM3a]|nr:hypothetical protein IQ06DRAFT_303546 [Stagonospora sp. SRC1lsM3a]
MPVACERAMVEVWSRGQASPDHRCCCQSVPRQFSCTIPDVAEMCRLFWLLSPHPSAPDCIHRCVVSCSGRTRRVSAARCTLQSAPLVDQTGAEARERAGRWHSVIVTALHSGDTRGRRPGLGGRNGTPIWAHRSPGTRRAQVTVQALPSARCAQGALCKSSQPAVLQQQYEVVGDAHPAELKSTASSCVHRDQPTVRNGSSVHSAPSHTSLAAVARARCAAPHSI